MTDTTTNLLLPYLLAAQAQKHVTHNEALRLLDGLVQLAVLDRDRTAPPTAPAEGDRHLVATGATGLWAGWDGDVALWTDGAWLRLPARDGWRVWVSAEVNLVLRIGAAWLTLDAALNLVARAETVAVAAAAGGASTGMAVFEQTLAGLTGASVDSTVLIPNGAILLGVSTRTLAAVLGATSFDCGIAGAASKFGGSLGVAAGASNLGVIGPEAITADTPVRLTAHGADFAGGTVRIAIHCLICTAPA